MSGRRREHGAAEQIAGVPAATVERRVRAVAGAAYGLLPFTGMMLAAGPFGRQRARLFTKPLLMPTLAARFVSAPRGPGFRRIVAAQAFSWGGDVALIGEGRRPFLTGLGSFLAAHVAYVSAYRTRSSEPVLATPGRRRLLVAGGSAATGMALAAGREDRAVVMPVAAYGLTLTAMVAAAAAIDRDRGRNMVLAGALLFLVSDTLIGVRRFLLDNGAPAVEVAVMATYTAGQWCISEGMSCAGNRRA